MKLELRGITKAFGPLVANDHIDLTVEPGQIHALLGENGAGKSTLMNVLYGLHQPDAGEILIDDEPVTFSGPGDAVAAGIGMVHQHFMLVPVFTVAESVALGYEPVGPMGIIDAAAAAARVREISERFGFDVDPDALIEDLQEAGIDPAVAIEKVVIEHDELTLFIAREHLLDVARPLRDDQDLRFELCLGVNGVHYPDDPGRELHACFALMSLTHGGRQLRLEVACPATDPHVPSIVSVYPGDDWHERETWDLMGIVFDGHPHLTRTAMPDDWVGHPQRKDYPLGGIPVEYKGAQTPPADTRRSYR